MQILDVNADLLEDDTRGSADAAPEFIIVPLQYRGRILGIYTLFLDRSGAELGDDFRDLLTTVGRHLALSIEKSRLDENTRRLAIMEEREILRNELHDSLAQSLVSMRLQVKMLGETLYKKDVRTAENEVRQLRLALDEAHTSLRDLLASFRSKMDDRGLIPALEDMATRFRQDTGILTFFQHDCDEVNLSPAQEVEVYRIVQEALTNIRKHSRAQTARIMLNGGADGTYKLLIEDDGVGIAETFAGPLPRRGEHIGLAIMRERAQRLRGVLTIESEPGEGTRISLTFSPYKIQQAAVV
jgi:two-component system nitrate/nitrite sensor histidine kinase NarX